MPINDCQVICVWYISSLLLSKYDTCNGCLQGDNVKTCLQKNKTALDWLNYDNILKLVAHLMLLCVCFV